MLQIRRSLNRLAPRTLFGRSLLIVVLPLILLQVVLTVIFYNRHWDTVTRWLAAGVAGEVALLAEELEATTDPTVEDAIMERFRRHTELRISFELKGSLAHALATAGIDSDPRGHIDDKILEAFQEKLTHHRFAVDLRGASGDDDDRIAVYVQLDDGLLRVLAARKRVTSTTTWLLLAWMVGASLLLAAIALYFLRRQLRPIRRLARAAESFGKGRDVGDVRPQGALEIRQAAHAFNLMRHRILRHVGQRTELLAAVSHDLRTPLTRMRLALELMGPDGDPGGLRSDLDEMAKLVESYLAFARGEGREAVEPTALRPILDSMRERAERSGVALEINMDVPLILPLRPLAFRRCLANLVDNACRYAGWIGITVDRKDEFVEIAVEDDGPGIPDAYRDKVLQPFFRLDESRGREAGTGLGLTIARDVVLGHGGELRLDRSSRGGLRALLSLPA